MTDEKIENGRKNRLNNERNYFKTASYMKQFLKMLLAVLAGFAIITILGIIFLGGMAGAMMAGGAKTGATSVPKNAILKVDMSRISIGEQAFQDFSGMISAGPNAGEPRVPQGILDITGAIFKAAEDPSVKVLYLKTDEIMAGITQVEEIRAAVSAFRAAGKSVLAYTENPTSGSYYLASAADKVYMTDVEGAAAMITGISTTMIYFKDLLDKLGVNVQLIRHGKYKSAGEPFIRSTPSAENLAQTTSMVESMWESIVVPVSESRNMTPESFRALVDDLRLDDAKSMLAAGLIDGIVSRQDLEEKLGVLAGTGSDKVSKHIITISDYIALNPRKTVGKNSVAVIFAEGDIVEGKSAAPGSVTGDGFAEIIRNAEADSSVKAVVLRVASPGGSVTASDKIRKAIDKLALTKPVIASYGEYAASGGYWISSSCSRIYTDATTLTGSIGVFSMLPDLSKTAKNVFHVGLTSVSSTRHGALMDMLTPLDDAEKAYFQKSVDQMYGSFVSLVAEGRQMEVATVDSLAQGRVWTGAQAVGNGLADTIGTLDDAIGYAISLVSGSSDRKGWNIVTYPEVPSPMAQFLAFIGESVGEDNQVLAGTPFAGAGKAFRKWNAKDAGKVYARLPWEYAINF